MAILKNPSNKVRTILHFSYTPIHLTQTTIPLNFSLIYTFSLSHTNTHPHPYTNSAECNDIFGDPEKNMDGRRSAPSVIVDENTGFALVVNGHSLVHCLSPELESK